MYIDGVTPPTKMANRPTLTKSLSLPVGLYDNNNFKPNGNLHQQQILQTIREDVVNESRYDQEFQDFQTEIQISFVVTSSEALV